MKKKGIIRFIVAAAWILGSGMAAYAAEPSEKARQAIAQEIAWLKAEAEGTVTIATKTKMSVDEAPSIVSVITDDQIRNSGAKSLDEILRQVAGFNVYKESTFPDSVVNIRGLGGTSNMSFKIMVNGHSTENALDGVSGWIPGFPPALIKKIEIIRGPGSALYGNGAMNGVINIITKDTNDPSAVSARYGSFDTYGATGQLSYSKNDFGLFLFADYGHTDGDPQLIGKDAASAMFPPGFGRAPGYSNEEFRSHAIFGKLSYNNAYLTGFLKQSRGENPVGISNALTDENKVRDPFGFAEAGYEGKLSDCVRMSAKAYYDYKQQDFVYELFDQKTTALLGFPKDQGIIGFPESKTKKIGSEIMMTFGLPSGAEIVSGALFEYLKTYDVKVLSNTDIIGRPMILDGVTYMPMQYLGGIRDTSQNYNYLDVEKTKRTVYAGYVQGTWNLTEAFPSLKDIGKNLTLTAGLRYDDYDDVGNSTNPRMGIVYAPNDLLFFKILYGEAFRAPSFGELHMLNNPAVVGNPNLKPETVKTSEIQAGINLTKQITATLDFFHIRKENTIRLYQGLFSNRGEIESQGVEGEIRASLDKSKYAYFNMTFQKVKDTTHEMMTDSGGKIYVQDDFDLGNYPKIMANLGVNSDVGQYVNANVWVSYVGQTERSGKMGFTASATDPDGTLEKADKRDPVGSYALTNFSLIFHNFEFAKGWEFQVTGYNIFNADQRDPDPDGSVPDDLPRWGRSFLGKISYSF